MIQTWFTSRLFVKYCSRLFNFDTVQALLIRCFRIFVSSQLIVAVSVAFGSYMFAIGDGKGHQHSHLETSTHRATHHRTTPFEWETTVWGGEETAEESVSKKDFVQRTSCKVAFLSQNTGREILVFVLKSGVCPKCIYNLKFTKRTKTAHSAGVSHRFLSKMLDITISYAPLRQASVKKARVRK